MIASVGLLVLMQDAFRIVFGEQGVTFRSNPFALRVYDIAGVSVNAVQIAIVVAAVMVFVGLHIFTTRTRIGVAWRATVSKPQIAASFGVDAIKVRYLNFALVFGARRRSPAASSPCSTDLLIRAPATW